MPQISVDPVSGRLMLDGQVLDQHDPRLWGAIGRNIFNDPRLAPTTTNEGDNGISEGELDTRYYEQVEVPDGEGGTRLEIRLKPEIAERLGGRVQVAQSGVGGFAEVIDPTQVEWDEEFGFLTKPENIKEPDTLNSDLWGRAVMSLVAGGFLGIAGADLLATVGAGGSGTGASTATDWFGPGGGISPEAASGIAGDQMIGGASGMDFFGPGGGISPEASGVDLFGPGGGISPEAASGITGDQMIGGANGLGTSTPTYDDFLDDYLNRFDGDAMPEGWVDNLPQPNWWDSIVDSAGTLGSRLIDRLPAIANALKPLAEGGPGSRGPGSLPGGSHSSFGGSGGGGGGGGMPSADLTRMGLSGGGGFGGGGGGGARGAPLDLQENPYGKMKQLQEVLSLAEYLSGVRK